MRKLRPPPELKGLFEGDKGHLYFDPTNWTIEMLIVQHWLNGLSSRSP